jgi:hypothetical protein
MIGVTALAAALAFGIGGRDAAAQLINSGYRKAQDETVKADLTTGKDCAEHDATALRTARQTVQRRAARSSRSGTAVAGECRGAPLLTIGANRRDTAEVR